MKKYFKLIVAGFIAMVFIGTFVFLWIQSRPKTVEYEEITPAVKDIRKTSVITGKIEPRNEVAVKPQISGIITDIYKDAGEMVTEGEVIAKVKVIPDMAQLSSAEARVRLANINMEQAKVDYEREKVRCTKPTSRPKRKWPPRKTTWKWCAMASPAATQREAAH